MKPRQRNRLTKDQVLQIFRRKFVLSLPLQHVKTSSVAKEFGVSAKAIRDIWIGRTWYKDTFHLDPYRADALERLRRQVGRPKGSRDLKPRKRKENSHPLYTVACLPSSDSVASIQNFPMSTGQVSATSSSACFWFSQIKYPGTSPKRPNYVSKAFDQRFDPASLIDQTLMDFIDPFHEDWPYW